MFPRFPAPPVQVHLGHGPQKRRGSGVIRHPPVHVLAPKPLRLGRRRAVRPEKQRLLPHYPLLKDAQVERKHPLPTPVPYLRIGDPYPPAAFPAQVVVGCIKKHHTPVVPRHNDARRRPVLVEPDRHIHEVGHIAGAILVEHMDMVVNVQHGGPPAYLPEHDDASLRYAVRPCQRGNDARELPSCTVFQKEGFLRHGVAQCTDVRHVSSSRPR